jgi:ABC-type microcin C transport system duplicated ATPase subunit YejF
MTANLPSQQLWKRRYLEIDTQGYLVLKPNDTTTIHKNINNDKKLERRYHLSHFVPPFAPDMERMEMPYSVVLDFKDGGTLQIAADSGSGQSSVLRGK